MIINKFKPYNSGYLYTTLNKLNQFTTSYYDSPSDYINKFEVIYNKLYGFNYFKFNNNVIIQQFYRNLNTKY